MFFHLWRGWPASLTMCHLSYFLELPLSIYSAQLGMTFWSYCGDYSPLTPPPGSQQHRSDIPSHPCWPGLPLYNDSEHSLMLPGGKKSACKVPNSACKILAGWCVKLRLFNRCLSVVVNYLLCFFHFAKSSWNVSNPKPVERPENSLTSLLHPCRLLNWGISATGQDQLQDLNCHDQIAQQRP